MKWFLMLLVAAMAVAGVFHHAFHVPVVVFVAASAALMLLSYFLGEATEQLSTKVGDKAAGLINVSFSNLAELIIIFVAVRANLIDVVRAGIVGSIMGNVLLVLGLSIVVGCHHQGTLRHNRETAMLLINQLFLVGATLMLPTLFHDHIPESNRLPFSFCLAAMLVGAYVYYYVLSFRDKRFSEIKHQHRQIHQRWSLPQSVGILTACGLAAFWMSELLIGEIEPVAASWGWSPMFVGFIILPLLGNVAERQVAITAARKNRPELSLAISIGSASQVGMIIAPCAVLFGIILGQPVTLYFASLPLGALLVSLAGGYLVLRDDKWNVNEGVLLVALYLAMVMAFWFTK